MEDEGVVLVRKYKLRTSTTRDGRKYLEVSLPTDWVKLHGLDEGDEVVVGADRFVVIGPSGSEVELLKLLSELVELKRKPPEKRDERGGDAGQ